MFLFSGGSAYVVDVFFSGGSDYVDIAPGQCELGVWLSVYAYVKTCEYIYLCGVAHILRE